MESDKRDVLERILDYDTCTDYDIDEAAEEIKRLRADRAATQKQRDEVTAHLRNACEEIAQRAQYASRTGSPHTGEQIAVERGWKCYE